MSRLLEDEISSSFGEDFGLNVGSRSVDGDVGEAKKATEEGVSFGEKRRANVEREGEKDRPDDHVQFRDHGIERLENGDVGS